MNRVDQISRRNRLFSWLNKELTCYIRDRINMINMKNNVHESDIEYFQSTHKKSLIYTNSVGV
jgi:hypothetical protein